MQPQALRHHPRFQLLHRALLSAANFGPSSSLGLHTVVDEEEEGGIVGMIEEWCGADT